MQQHITVGYNSYLCLASLLIGEMGTNVTSSISLSLPNGGMHIVASLMKYNKLFKKNQPCLLSYNRLWAGICNSNPSNRNNLYGKNQN